MENKYYTPKLEEFHVGFRFEVLNNEVWDWQNMNASRLQEINLDDNLNLMSKYRVKCLDKEDIESLGFKKSNKNSWIGYKDYFLDSINPEYPYFLFATIHIPIRDDMYKILVHRYYNEDEPIDEDDNYREPTCVYVGKIKNKSELNQLLKRLNIINE